MANHEAKIKREYVHVLLALSRNKFTTNKEVKCLRHIDYNIGNELEIFKEKLKIIGGYWRIHRTVNARDVEKSRIELMTRLIKYPEKAQWLETEWRTVLLQKDNIYGEKRFMLDIDTEKQENINIYESIIKRDGGIIYEKHKSPNGWHYITNKFDTRELCNKEYLHGKYISLIRDGYYFIEEINQQNQ